MATSRDVQEIIAKLSSDKAKARDEGVRLFSSWLEGERSIGFCKLLGQNTARLKPDEIPHAETWPFLLTLLTKCITLEISARKKRQPKLVWAKTLRTAIQCAEDPKLSGRTLLLLSVVRRLLNHISDVIGDVSSFQSEYSSILRHLLAIKEYRYQLRKQTYCKLVVLYVNKVGAAIAAEANIQCSSKEEVFRFILTLHVLLENPPGDFPDIIRDDVINGFVAIFSHIRDEGKIARKLIECINTYLLRDGPNVGCRTMDIHSAVEEFIFRCWLTTHDRALKCSFILYARIQLKLRRSMMEGSQLVGQLLDVIAKELDQTSLPGPWCDASKDDRVGAFGGIQKSLIDLAATVLYQACINMKTSCQKDHLKVETTAVRVKDGLMKGLLLWIGAFCFLIHNYGCCLDKSLLIYWFEGASQALQRILNDSNTMHSYDAVVWLLRALQEFSSMLILPSLTEGPSQFSSFSASEASVVRNGWHAVWTCVVHTLPTFSKLSPVVDAALVLLSNLLLRDQISVAAVPQDFWDLRIFNYMPSSSALCFIACYFSKKGVQGDLRDALHLRKNLLRATLGLMNFKEPGILNDHTITLIPSAIFSICSGCEPFVPCYRGAAMLIDAKEDWAKQFFLEEGDWARADEVLDCSVKALAEIKSEMAVQTQIGNHHGVRLPRKISQPLFHELEDYLSGLIASNGNINIANLSDIFLICCLLSNLIYGLLLTRLSEERSPSLNKLFEYILKLLDHVISRIEEKHDEVHNCGLVGFNDLFDTTGKTSSSLQCFVSSPFFSLFKKKYDIDCDLHHGVFQSIEGLSMVLGKLYLELFHATSNVAYSTMPDFPHTDLIPIQDNKSLDGSEVRIIDMELDAEDRSNDVEALATVRSKDSVISPSPAQWKLEIVSAISCFVSVSALFARDVLFDLIRQENDPKVCQTILFSLCKHFSGSSETLSALINSINTTMEISGNQKLSGGDTLSAILALLQTLLPSGSTGKHENAKDSMDIVLFKENLKSLVDVIARVAEIDLPDWSARIKLIDCICSFILLEPNIAQTMVEKLLAMSKDPDYRVRLFLARRLAVLFQTWDGHQELFDDICSNFGFDIVRSSKDRQVKGGEISAVGSYHHPAMETAIVTLAHVAFCSEQVEVEAVFMLCVIAAMNSCHRSLTYAILDTLSGKLRYASRAKYLEELMGAILFRWVACEVSLMALVEVRDLFAGESETKTFMQHCCPWLLPALILGGDTKNLNLVAEVACQPLPLLAKEHFVPIFAVCMALHCSGRTEKEMGGLALRDSVLQIAKITELERDDLIKKHMVSIVSFLLSLSSSSIDPMMPLFSKDTVVLSVQTVVDGFLEMDDHPTMTVIIDKINVFRSDRVFKFLVEIHRQITTARHARHKCHRLAVVEVLITIIGHRAALSSTSSYIVNMVMQCIENQSLHGQCCRILSTLLEAFRANHCGEIVSVLGEQLQFLVSKLVACCICEENQGQTTGASLEKFISLLLQLTVDADPSLYDYVRELVPFPELDCFEKIRIFHEELSKAYSPREQFLKFVKRTCHLPHGLLVWSLHGLDKQLFFRKIFKQDTDGMLECEGNGCWSRDPELVSSVWTLVGLCRSEGESEMCAMLADAISAVGIGDPYRVVFSLPGDPSQGHLCEPSSHGSSTALRIYRDSGTVEELLVDLLKLLKKYLLYESVETIDLTSRTLQGILSSESGQHALLSLDLYEKSLLMVHSKGVNLELVEKLLFDSQKSSSGPSLLDNSSLWWTEQKTYEMWVCPLVHSLIRCSDDIILRLCQNIVLVKSEVAELLFANILVNLAGTTDSRIDLCQLISVKVQQNIFVKSNSMIKSIQVFLNALNKLRSFYVIEKASISASFKQGKSSSSAKIRGTAGKAKDCLSNIFLSSSSWIKVFWLNIDYLVVAEAAIRCGSYFTAVMYVEHWCEEHFKSLTLGSPDFSHSESLPLHIDLLVSAFSQINEPDSIYGIIQSHKLSSQIITYEHEGNWSKALEYHDLLVRSSTNGDDNNLFGKAVASNIPYSDRMVNWELYKGLIRSLQKTGCTHVLDVYCQGLISSKGHFMNDLEFTELQYEAAWRAGNWDFSWLTSEVNVPQSQQYARTSHFNENMHSCLQALQEGDSDEFNGRLMDSKKELVLFISNASKESTEYIYTSIIKLQILDHLSMAWNLRWKSNQYQKHNSDMKLNKLSPEPVIPTKFQLEQLNADWSFILKGAQLNLNLLEPFIAFRRVLLQILDCKECTVEHLLQSASTLRKGSRFSLATAALHELKLLHCQTGEQLCPHTFFLGRLEEAKVLWAQGQQEMAINLSRCILENCEMGVEAPNVYRLVGKWLAETRSCNSRTILDQYLKHSVELAESNKSCDSKSISRQCQAYFCLAHYTDGLFKSYEERLSSSEWQAAMRLRKHKTKELDALIRRLKSSTKGEKVDFSIKIQELQKQLSMDREEADKLQDDRDNFLSLSLEAYQRCLVIGGKYDLRVVFRLVSLWFSLSSRESVIRAMLSTVKEVQSYKFIPLVYQIASRLGSSKDGPALLNFQIALVSLVKKMAIEHPYHTIFQLLALANGDRIKDKQRSRNSFVVDMDKKLAAENLLNELSSFHGATIRQMKQMVEIYIKLAELETRKEETNRKMPLPREIRSLRQLELVPVVTATIPVDPTCKYGEGSFPHFTGLADSVMVMNGINAPKLVECYGSDGHKYRQLAKSGNDDLRQDAVMEQFFGLVNTFLQSHRDTWKRKLRIRTYKVVPFTPSAGVLEWVDRTIPLGEYLLGSSRNGGAHGRYGVGDWTFLQCREHMANERDKRKAFLKVCSNFRPVMHYFFLERFLQPADWFEGRLSYTRSVAASSMVGYIVGLGDRHSMNVLIDQATAEVVHIDLGVAFEQGLMLKTPERVPFRLTRDIIDGMGVTGVEGVFRRCCEETLAVMRTNKEALLTIIEVFIHDPLYKWALSPLKALQRQKETDDDTDSFLESSQDAYEGNKDAARATLRVKQKLDGYEEGELRSVRGQVQQLIQDATDTDRLSQMFPGWGAWL